MQSKHRRVGWIWKIGIGLVCLFIIFKLAARFRTNSTVEVIRSVRVERGDLTVKITATGEVKPQNRVEVKPPIDGRIEKVMVEEGEEVKQGQVLAWMSSTERAAILDSARSEGEETFKRWQNAYKPAPLIAPVDGMIIVRAAEPGQTVTKTDPVVVISDRLIVEALVDETDLSLISLGQEAKVSLDAYPERTVKAIVDHISYESKLVNNVNVYAVDILTEKVPSMFRSGMTATVTFIITDREAVLLVPSEAITGWPQNVENPEGADFAVYKKTFSGKPSPVPIRIGKSDGRFTEILEGLSEGAEIQVVRRKKADMGTNPFSPWRRRKKKESSK